MAGFFKSRWILFLVLIVFVICKIPHLYYPYYWDESWVYAPAVAEMYLHGPSLLPGVIDESFSRGHPLFFHALYATWVKIFGFSQVALHSLSVIISSCLIVALYETGLKLFNQRVAIVSIVLLVFHFGFFANSSFVLPDVLIALLVLLSIYYYVVGRYFLTGLCLTLLFYTKESGLVLGVVLGIYTFCCLFDKKLLPKVKLFKCLSIGVPVVLIALFFIIQKVVRGWYMYPEHLGIINVDYGHATYWFRVSLVYLFEQPAASVLLLVLSVIAVVKQKSIKYAFLFLPALLIYLLRVEMTYTELVSTVLMALLFTSIAVAFFFLKRTKYYSGTPAEHFVFLNIVFLIAYLYFSSINFFEYRYLLPAQLVLFILLAIFFDFLVSSSYPVLVYPFIAIVVLAGFQSFRTDDGTSDLGAFDGMDLQQSIVDYCERNNLYDRVISAGSYQDVIHLRNPNSGYLRSNKTFKKVKGGRYDAKTEYVIFESVELDDFYYDCKKDPAFKLVFRDVRRRKWVEIYKRM